MTRLAILSVLMSYSLMLSSQSIGATTLPDDEKGRCRYAAEYMIGIAKQSFSHPGSRPERIEKRQKLVDDWSTRLKKGEDPCVVYADVQRSATTF